MKVAFRADASITIGSGHVMRCLTLADQLRDLGNETLFLVRDQPGNMAEEIEGRGHRLCLLPACEMQSMTQAADPPYASWLGADVATDANECISVLADWGSIDWLVVDHYGVDQTWETRLRPHVEKIMVIDDLADRPHQCDLLLDQNLQSQNQRYLRLLPLGSRQLLGPRFALLRPEFRQLREQRTLRDGRIKKLLVFLGGGDSSNVTTQVIHGIRESAVATSVTVDIVIGGANPHRSALEEACRTLANVRLHVQTAAIAELMAQADLMIGTPGVTSWERCCLGLPALLMSVAENQVENGRQLANHRAALYMGDASSVSTSQFAHALSLLCSRPGLLRRMAERAYRITDGVGVSRVVLAMHADEIRIRPARSEDCETVWRWRNDPRTRKNAFDSQAIAFETHQAWYATVMTDPRRILLFGQIAGQNVGVLRYDGEEGAAEISVYLDPELHGLGLGSKLIAAGSRWVTCQRTRVRTLIARVRPENKASLNAFLAAGYRSRGDATVLYWQKTD